MADFEVPIIHFMKPINNTGSIPLGHGLTAYRRYLIEFENELLLIDKIFSLRFQRNCVVSDFEIYQLDRQKDTWMKMKNIGN